VCAPNSFSEEDALVIAANLVRHELCADRCLLMFAFASGTVQLRKLDEPNCHRDFLLAFERQHGVKDE